MNGPTFDPLVVAQRVYAVRSTRGVDDNPQEPTHRKVPRHPRRQRRQPQRTLVLDTETSTDPSQRLLFGAWRYFVDRWDRLPGHVCIEEGIFYADDLPARDPKGFALLCGYVETHEARVAAGRSTRVLLLSRSQFVERALWRYAFNQGATVVGFNLPFDLSRLAIATAPARGRLAGGVSLRLWDVERYRPRIAYKSIDSKRTLIGFTTPDDAELFRGHFLDLRTLTFSLTDRGHSLESASEVF